MKKIIWILSLLMISVSIAAQSGFTNSGNLQMHAASSMTVFGNFRQSSSGSFTNHGSLYLKASLVNDLSSMNAGNGNLYLNGNVLQNISGTQPFKTNNLYTNNPSGFNLTNDLRVSGIHYFESGMVQTSTTNFLVYESGSSYTGAGDLKHVNGSVKKIGTTDFIFPVGNVSVHRPISISGISAPAEFNAKYYQATINKDRIQAPIVRINPNEYWTLTTSPGITASVTLNWDNNKVPFQNWYVAEITTSNYNGSVWTDIGGTASGNVQSTGNITSGVVTSFNMFSLGSKAYPLPVKLIDFNAKKLSNQTEVKWVSTNEQDISFYEVQRSDNGRDFYSIGKLSGRNSGNIENYTFSDFKEIQAKAYYRLRIIENINQEKFSHIELVTAGSLNSQLKMVLNPVVDQIVLYAGTGLKGNFEYRIHSPSGQEQSRGKLNIQNNGQYSIPVNFIPGTYILEVKNQLERFVFKFEVK